MIKINDDVIDFYAKYRNKQENKCYTLSDIKFFVPERYEVLQIIGQGAYGIVTAALDLENQIDHPMVAIKKIEKAFEHKIFAKRTLRELRLARLMNHENVLGIKSILLPKSREEFHDIYVVTELMETDLYQIIKNQQLDDEQVRFFLYQILRGLKYIHSAGVLHRDLKPRNLLVNKNCDMKICDFGLARAINQDIKSDHLTHYVTTRWYRAPELLLSWNDYNQAVDVWSVGCIFAELLNGRPFLPGMNTKNQISLIFQMIGTPSEADLNSIPKHKYRKLAKQFPKFPGKDFNAQFPGVPPDALDLLKKFLRIDPKLRITVDDALSHPYLSQFHNQEDEPISVPVQRVDFEFDQYNLNLQQIKDCLYEEILLYHFNDFRQQYELNRKKGESIIQHILQNSNSKQHNPDLDYDIESSGDEY